MAKVARKDSLALKLAQRPDIQELIDKNIYIAHSEQESHETKEDVKKKLTRYINFFSHLFFILNFRFYLNCLKLSKTFVFNILILSYQIFWIL